jgi:hypothetical protein
MALLGRCVMAVRPQWEKNVCDHFMFLDMRTYVHVVKEHREVTDVLSTARQPLSEEINCREVVRP